MWLKRGTAGYAWEHDDPPLMFLSSAMVPKSFMPEWIRVITKINPIDYAVEAIRAFYSGGVSLRLS